MDVTGLKGDPGFRGDVLRMKIPEGRPFPYLMPTLVQ